ncbi:MAG: prolyl oligopeptidase family serine peptidase [Bacteroidetes bacterium]|nr:prolyl oligopeptidase family serine peptidase [Bacteroidota bacterium]
MKKIISILLLIPIISFSQKKPLDHSVYDSWQSIGEKLISANGKFVAYTINLQEGDANLVIQSTTGNKLIEVERGYNITISDDDKFVVFKIKPTYKQTRDAKIAKKKPDEMPKDSLGIYDVEQNKLEKIARVKSYKMPEKAGGWLAYLMEKPLPETKDTKEPDSATTKKNLDKRIERLQKELDSLQLKNNELLNNGFTAIAVKKDTTAKPKKEEDIEEGTELVLRNLTDGKEQKIKLVQEYYFSKKGNAFVVETTKKNGSKIKSTLIIYHSKIEDEYTNPTDTVLTGFVDAKQLTFSDDESKFAFYVTFKKKKNEQKEYELPEFERVNVDVWNYKDDDLMTAQLKNLDAETKKSFLAMIAKKYNEDEILLPYLVQLGSPKFEPIRVTQEGDGKYFYAVSDSGKRLEQQWQGFTKKDVFVINSNDGSKKQIMSNVRANIYPSYTGKYLLVYDEDKKQYSCYDADGNKIKAVAKDIPYPLYDEENDVPDAPNAYGIVKWMENDKYVLIYDRYDIWKVDPTGKEKSVCITNGRKDKIQCRYVTVDNDEKFIKEGQDLVFKSFNENDKKSFYNFYDAKSKNCYNLISSKFLHTTDGLIVDYYSNCNNILKSKTSSNYIFTNETYKYSQELYFVNFNITNPKYDLDNRVIPDKNNSNIEWNAGNYLCVTNLQQHQYLWGAAELFKWKAYSGKLTEGVLYKPENFDSTKKYPMIVYFYERLSNTLHNYIPPAPTASRLNISYFVSNGYVVFVPDIWYTTGHPGKSAYDCIVSGTRALIKKGFIDSTRIGLQGQSWGGYQTAYLITQTNLYKAAWAGAPVGNMFSAYGGIRWESGLNRQFQYEHQQSRIGATIWEKPNLYIENSPLFHLPKVKTPLVIMHNDADGAVPWYQGIELFTAMRRLNKPVWMLNYNGEAHNLMERKNRKDIQVKEQQYFDWLLKDAPAPKWITEGVPAVMKGRVQ